MLLLCTLCLSAWLSPVHEHQRRHILAAHRLVHKVIEHTPTDYSLPTAEEVSKEPTSSADLEQDQPETNQELHS